MASGVMPALSFCRIISTGTRVPRITGLPPMISGFISIRSDATGLTHRRRDNASPAPCPPRPPAGRRRRRGSRVSPSRTRARIRPLPPLAGRGRQYADLIRRKAKVPEMTPTFIQHPTHYTLAEFRTMLAGVELGAWRPRFPTLHNTGVPSLNLDGHRRSVGARASIATTRAWAGTPGRTWWSVRTMSGCSAISRNPASRFPAGIPRRSESR